METYRRFMEIFSILKKGKKGCCTIFQFFPMPGEYKMIDKTFTYSTYFTNLVKIWLV